jgi:hypothetical protein
MGGPFSPHQAFHPAKGVSDGSGQRGFARDRGELHGQPSLKVIEDLGSKCAAVFGAAVRCRSAGLFLDGIEPRDPADGFFGDG